LNELDPLVYSHMVSLKPSPAIPDRVAMFGVDEANHYFHPYIVAVSFSNHLYNQMSDS